MSINMVSLRGKSHKRDHAHAVIGGIRQASTVGRDVPDHPTLSPSQSIAKRLAIVGIQNHEDILLLLPCFTCDRIGPR